MIQPGEENEEVHGQDLANQQQHGKKNRMTRNELLQELKNHQLIGSN